MDFGLSQDQLLLKDTVKRFLAEKCPGERVRQIMESDSGHDEVLWRGLADLGVPALMAAADHGGLERELLDLALVAEELGYAATPGPFLGNALATVALIESANPDLQARWLPGLVSGEQIGTIAIGEDGADWEPTRFTAQVKDGQLSGTKSMVPYASVADFIVVGAVGEAGAGLWLVERGATGIEITSHRVNDMTRRIDTVAFRNTPATALAGAAALSRLIDAGCVLLAADCYGGARRCLEMAASYALQREQFGQIIGAFQAVKHQLANMAADLEPSLALYWYAAHAFDRIQDQSARHAAMAKAHLCDLYDRVTRDATEIHGGIGFTWEFDLHLWFRRAMFDRGFLGDATDQRDRAADLAGW